MVLYLKNWPLLEKANSPLLPYTRDIVIASGVLKGSPYDLRSCSVNLSIPVFEETQINPSASSTTEFAPRNEIPYMSFIL